MTAAASSLHHGQSAYPPLLMRRDTAAAFLDISPTTFDRWICDGHLGPGTRVGGVRLWHRDDLAAAADRLLNRATADGPGNPWDQK